MIEHVFYSVTPGTACRADRTGRTNLATDPQPQPCVARLMRVAIHPVSRSSRRVALELVLRALAAALATLAILGFLPAVVGAVA
jgi:hypothetical protein